MKAILIFTTMFMFLYLVNSQTERYFLPEVNGKLAKGNFFYAYQLCKQNDLLLVTPDTEEKNKALLKFMEENSIPRTWMSATDLAQEGQFVWMTNGRPVTYTYWHDNQPDNNNGEGCGELIYVFDNLKWNDGPCTNVNVVTCEEARIKMDDGAAPAK